MEGAIVNRLQMATLMSWAGETGVEGRKRLQKVVFFLQQAGCPIDCHYTLHHFGPYSRDVADICDEMVAADLIDETAASISVGKQYTYRLRSETSALLKDTTDAGMARFKSFGESLIAEKLWSLELGSTILYFHKQSGNWNDAMIKACQFKKVPVDIEKSNDALKLAQRLVAEPVNN